METYKIYKLVKGYLVVFENKTKTFKLKHSDKNLEKVKNKIKIWIEKNL